MRSIYDKQHWYETIISPILNYAKYFLFLPNSGDFYFPTSNLPFPAINSPIMTSRDTTLNSCLTVTQRQRTRSESAVFIQHNNNNAHS